MRPKKNGMKERKSSDINNLPLFSYGIKKWYRHKKLILDEINKQNESKSSCSLSCCSFEETSSMRQEAIQYLKQDYYLYQQITSQDKSLDMEWIKQIIQNGTVNDKLAANVVLIQHSTIHNLKSLEMLMKFCSTKAKRECLMAIDTVRDLFIGDLLIPEERLQSFEDLVKKQVNFLVNVGDSNVQNGPFDSKLVKLRKKLLVVSYVEDQIRFNYHRFIQECLRPCSMDCTLGLLKIKSIRTCYELFLSNREQESQLLSILVNKLGDPQPKIASTTGRLLSQILQNFPLMKMILVKQIEQFLFTQTNLSSRQEYYCLCFLSELIYQYNVDQPVATRVIQIYFSLFRKFVGKGQIHKRIMSVLLTGVCRAFPYANGTQLNTKDYLETFFKLTYYVHTNVAIQIISLLFQLIQYNPDEFAVDRYYCLLYRLLFRPKLDQCSKLSLLLNVLYRSMKKDPVLIRVHTFVKRLLQISLTSSTSFTIAVLLIISQLIKFKAEFKIEWKIAIDRLAIGLTTSKHCEEDCQLLIGNVKQKSAEKSAQVKSSWVYVDLKNESEEYSARNGTDNGAKCYEMNCRNPLYSNVNQEPFLFELFALKYHFHSTVRIFTESLLQGCAFEYDGDPLEDFSIKRFLDKFAFKNPKSWHHKMEQKDKLIPARALVFGRRRLANSNVGLKAKSHFDSGQSVDHVPLDEMFIYNYLKAKTDNKKSIDQDDSDQDDVESVTSLEFNNLLDNYEDDLDLDADQHVDYAKHFKASLNHAECLDSEADFDEELGSSGGSSGGEGGEEEGEVHFEDLGPDLNIKKAANVAPFKGKNQLNEITNQIFASAQQLEHILNDQDEEHYEEDDGGNLEARSKSKSKSKSKPKAKAHCIGKRKLPNANSKNKKRRQ